MSRVLAGQAKPLRMTYRPLKSLLENRQAVIALLIISIVILAVIFGPMLSPHSYTHIDPRNSLSAPSIADGHWFGTDDLGRDLFARTMHGGRISMLVGLVSTAVSLIIGVSWGAIAGYAGGRIDHFMMRIVDILYAMPYMFFVIMLMVLFGRNFILIFVAIGAVNWLDMARIVRAQTLGLKRQAFVEAATISGVSSAAIITRHILPNLAGMVAVYATLTIPQVILVESFLSFLGLGVQNPMTSWGALVHQGVRIMEIAPLNLLIPAGFLALTLYCFNFIGDGLRDALDPRDSNR